MLIYGVKKILKCILLYIFSISSMMGAQSREERTPQQLHHFLMRNPRLAPQEYPQTYEQDDRRLGESPSYALDVIESKLSFVLCTFEEEKEEWLPSVVFCMCRSIELISFGRTFPHFLENDALRICTILIALGFDQGDILALYPDVADCNDTIIQNSLRALSCYRFPHTSELAFEEKSEEEQRDFLNLGRKSDCKRICEWNAALKKWYPTQRRKGLSENNLNKAEEEV